MLRAGFRPATTGINGRVLIAFAARHTMSAVKFVGATPALPAVEAGLDPTESSGGSSIITRIKSSPKTARIVISSCAPISAVCNLPFVSAPAISPEVPVVE